MSKPLLRLVVVAVFASVTAVSCNCGPNVKVDPTLPDAGPGTACGPCEIDQDCDLAARCVEVADGKACVPRCDPAQLDCPSGFECKAPAAGGQTACMPSAGACCVDQDVDTYGRGVGCAGPDCNDADPAVSPAAVEVCNGIDDNCNDQVDDGLGQLTCGVGECARSVEACVDGQAQTCTPGAPAAQETCNGLDDNCNGQTDDGLGDRSCGVGACLRTVPACVAGQSSICTAGDGGTEICNGIDDDCNELTDDNLGETTCGVGACLRTVQNCVGGLTQLCTAGDAGTEICNSADDDCNGQTDENLGSTSCGVGACLRTVENCLAGQTQTCSPGIAGTEICNGTDDDCNGSTDDGLGSTTCGVGACLRTTQNCVGGLPQTCTPGAASAEVCNGSDDDCNGQTDEGLGTTTCGLGACERTVESCLGGLPQTCTPGASGTETCNSIDDDCNGTADDGLGSTTCGVGACLRTVENCVGGLAQTCTPGATAAETCNGIDDDCDGTVDNGVQTTYYQDSDGDTYGTASVSTQACSPPAGYVTDSTDCNDAAAAVHPGATETCNGVDDDCSGAADEGNPGGAASCSTGELGVCAAGTTACTGGAIVCNRNTGPSPETCNGLDDDCNGTVDEGVKTTYYQDGDSDTYGNAAATTLACTLPAGYAANSTDCNDADATVNPGATETCNGVDDNCEGTIDEGVKTTFYQDADGDTYGNSAVTTQACSLPAGYVTNTTDCDDANGAVHPGATEVCNAIDDNCNGTVDEGVTTTYYRDADGDTYGNSSVSTQACSLPAGYVTNSTDCDDAAASVYPGATEVCNGADDDCDGTIDEGVKTTFYRDADSDTYGNLSVTAQACSAPAGYVAGSTDCNDSNAAVHPGATELCNAIDDNCNGTIDEGVKTTFYADADADTYGNPSVSTQACSQPAGYAANNTDCNDSNNAVHPGATEVCNGVDDNCAGGIDEGNPGGGVACGACGQGTTLCSGGALGCTNANAGLSTYYRDADGDSYGNAAVTTQACSQPAGYVSNATDCNDTVASIYPGATEVCNGADDNCNGTIDEGSPGAGVACITGQSGVCGPGTTQCQGASGVVCVRNVNPSAEVCNGLDDDCNALTDEGVTTTYYRDADNDTYGNVAVSVQACSAPAGYVTNSTDCNDANAAVKPGATEVCDGVDNNCNGTVDEGVTTTYYRDADTDTYGNAAVSTQACSPPAGYVANNTDCNDSNAAVHPAATETCNGVDDNCDGAIDEGVKTTYYRDADSDTYGTASVTSQACSAPAGYVADNTDCNDSNAAIKPGATEVCDGVDNNCNGTVDEGVKTTYYADADADTYGNPSISTQACSQPAGYVTNNVDCNDSNNAVHPGATELCNGIDDNCSGAVDEGNPGGGVACGACNQGTTLCSGGALTCTNPNQGLATYYRDVDGDGYGNAAVTTQACSQPAGYVSNATDCNDNNFGIHPGATETCNGADDDCDGSIDEGNPGGGIACSTGQLGVCAAGTTACSGGAVVCNRNVNPSTESCNSLDDNCDGMTDNGVVMPETAAKTCAGANSYVVNVAYGGTTDKTGYIDASGDDWFQVNFTGVPGAGGYYHPKIAFASNPGTVFKLQVFTSCGTPATGCSSTLDTFEMSYPSNPNGCNGTYGGFSCTDGSGRPTSFLVRVTRVSGSPYFCSGYTVRATDI